jgi:hypothetical protein
MLLAVSVQCVTSGFRRELGKTCALLGCYTASSGDFLPTFRDNLSVQSSGVKIQKKSCVITQKNAVLSKCTCYLRNERKWRKITTDNFHMDPVLPRGT